MSGPSQTTDLASRLAAAAAAEPSLAPLQAPLLRAHAEAGSGGSGFVEALRVGRLPLRASKASSTPLKSFLEPPNALLCQQDVYGALDAQHSAGGALPPSLLGAADLHHLLLPALRLRPPASDAHANVGGTIIFGGDDMYATLREWALMQLSAAAGAFLLRGVDLPALEYSDALQASCPERLSRSPPAWGAACTRRCAPCCTAAARDRTATPARSTPPLPVLNAADRPHCFHPQVMHALDSFMWEYSGVTAEYYAACARTILCLLQEHPQAECAHAQHACTAEKPLRPGLSHPVHCCHAAGTHPCSATCAPLLPQEAGCGGWGEQQAGGTAGVCGAARHAQRHVQR